MKFAALGGEETLVSPGAPTLPLDAEAVSTEDFRADRVAENLDEIGAVESDEFGQFSVPQTGERAWPASEMSPAREQEPTARVSAGKTTSLELFSGESLSDVNSDLLAPAGKSPRVWQAAAVVMLSVTFIAGGLAILASRGFKREEAGGSPISIPDRKQLFDERIAEAQALLSNNERDAALAPLKAASMVVPEAAPDQTLLGDAYTAAGAYSDAMTAYKSAILFGATDIHTWNALAEAQYKQGFYASAAESYRHLIGLVSSSNGSDVNIGGIWLAYNDALRLSKGPDDAWPASYVRTSGSNSVVTIRPTKRNLTGLARPPAVSRLTTEQLASVPSFELVRGASVASKPALPSVRTIPGSVPEMAKRDPEALFAEGLKIVNGRPSKKLERAELIRALEIFQYTEKQGSHRAEASQYADRLGKEFDRRKKW